MQTVYRIFKTKHRSGWSDGEGAFRFGGRWNSPGTRILYTASSLSLATLELFVHLNSEALLAAYSFASVTIDGAVVERVENLAELPDNWGMFPSPEETQRIGDEWVASGAGLVLSVPSAILPVERNYLINVGHSDFSKLGRSRPEQFVVDKRIIQKLSG
ncbi:RES family NAD+ phosphorylase [soil metagenome]